MTAPWTPLFRDTHVKDISLTDTTGNQDLLVALTSDIVAAHVSHNQLPVDQVSGLVVQVYQALSGLGVEQASEQPREPAVSIRASVRPDHVTCLECGKKMSMLKRHLQSRHGLSADEYRARWNLSRDHALTAPNYAERRAVLAKTIGLGRKPGESPKARKAPVAKTFTMPAAKVTAPVSGPATKAQPRKGKLGLRFKAAEAEVQG